MTRENEADDASQSPVRHGVATADARHGKPANRSRSTWIFFRDILLIFVAALLISFVIKTFLVRSFYIPSGSMEDTLLVNDRIIVNQLAPEIMPLKRGDVVVFKDPGGWLSPQVTPELDPFTAVVEGIMSFIGLSAPDSNDHLIKRVIGLPGDTVVCCNELGQITVNGVPLDEPYTKLPDGTAKATRSDFSITVPDDSLWVMGDNRYASADSAYHHESDPGREYVPTDFVVGRAILISWPLDRFAWLNNFPTVFRDMEPESR